MAVSIGAICSAQFKEIPPAPFSDAVARNKISALLQAVSPRNERETIAALSDLALWYRAILDDELVEAWKSGTRANLPDVVDRLADNRVASAIVEFSWRVQRQATFNLTYAPILGNLMARYPDSANPFLADLLSSARGGQSELILSRSESEAVCRILLDLPNSGNWRADALRILPRYQSVTESLLDHDINEGDAEKSAAARFWLDDLRQAGATMPRAEAMRQSIGDGGEIVSRPTLRATADSPAPTTAGQSALPGATGAAVSNGRNSAGRGMVMPVVLSSVQPEYTPIARRLNVEGTVTLSVLVGRDGLIRDVQTVKSLGYGLDSKAAEAVRKWKFEPGLNVGMPVDMRAQIDVTFRRVGTATPEQGWLSGPMTFVLPDGASLPEVTDGALPAANGEMPGDSVVLEFTVDANGYVRNIRAISGTSSAVDTLSRSLVAWTLRPAVLAGRPLEAIGRIRFVSEGGGAQFSPPVSRPAATVDADAAPQPAHEQKAEVGGLPGQSALQSAPVGTKEPESAPLPPVAPGNNSSGSGTTHGRYSQYKVSYTGGSLRDFRQGAAIKLSIDHGSIRMEGKSSAFVSVTANAVTEVIYSQDARNVFVPGVGIPSIGIPGAVAAAAGIGAIGALARTRKYYVGLRWERESIILEVSGNNDWRALIADLEGTTGLRASPR
jgi:TonB family protein